MLSGETTTLAANAARFGNGLRVRRSSRFLYAATDQFDLAHEVLARNAELRNIASLTQVGRMGGGTPRKPKMPAGLWLVIYGRVGHHMLAIAEWDERSRFIDVSTSDIGTLAMALRDRPFQQATVFQDGVERRGMREHIRIVHSDTGLNAILAYMT
jgi:hypothetical protein